MDCLDVRIGTNSILWRQKQCAKFYRKIQHLCDCFLWQHSLDVSCSCFCVLGFLCQVAVRSIILKNLFLGRKPKLMLARSSGPIPSCPKTLTVDEFQRIFGGFCLVAAYASLHRAHSSVSLLFQPDLIAPVIHCCNAWVPVTPSKSDCYLWCSNTFTLLWSLPRLLFFPWTAWLLTCFGCAFTTTCQGSAVAPGDFATSSLSSQELKSNKSTYQWSSLGSHELVFGFCCTLS